MHHVHAAARRSAQLALLRLCSPLPPATPLEDTPTITAAVVPQPVAQPAAPLPETSPALAPTPCPFTLQELTDHLQAVQTVNNAQLRSCVAKATFEPTSLADPKCKDCGSRIADHRQPARAWEGKDALAALWMLLLETVRFVVAFVTTVTRPAIAFSTTNGGAAPPATAIGAASENLTSVAAIVTTVSGTSDTNTGVKGATTAGSQGAGARKPCGRTRRELDGFLDEYNAEFESNQANAKRIFERTFKQGTEEHPECKCGFPIGDHYHESTEAAAAAASTAAIAKEKLIALFEKNFCERFAEDAATAATDKFEEELDSPEGLAKWSRLLGDDKNLSLETASAANALFLDPGRLLAIRTAPVALIDGAATSFAASSGQRASAARGRAAAVDHHAVAAHNAQRFTAAGSRKAKARQDSWFVYHHEEKGLYFRKQTINALWDEIRDLGIGERRVIIGSECIGKSWALNALLWLHVLLRPSDFDPVVVRDVEGWHYFEPSGHCHFESGSALCEMLRLFFPSQNQRVLLLHDYTSQICIHFKESDVSGYFGYRGFATVLACPPYEMSYGAFAKSRCRYLFLQPWTFRELQQLPDQTVTAEEFDRLGGIISMYCGMSPHNEEAQANNFSFKTVNANIEYLYSVVTRLGINTFAFISPRAERTYYEKNFETDIEHFALHLDGLLRSDNRAHGASMFKHLAHHFVSHLQPNQPTQLGASDPPPPTTASAVASRAASRAAAPTEDMRAKAAEKGMLAATLTQLPKSTTQGQAALWLQRFLPSGGLDPDGFCILPALDTVARAIRSISDVRPQAAGKCAYYKPAASGSALIDGCLVAGRHAYLLHVTVGGSHGVAPDELGSFRARVQAMVGGGGKKSKFDAVSLIVVVDDSSTFDEALKATSAGEDAAWLRGLAQFRLVLPVDAEWRSHTGSGWAFSYVRRGY